MQTAIDGLTNSIGIMLLQPFKQQIFKDVVDQHMLSCNNITGVYFSTSANISTTAAAY